MIARTLRIVAMLLVTWLLSLPFVYLAWKAVHTL